MRAAIWGGCQSIPTRSRMFLEEQAHSNCRAFALTRERQYCDALAALSQLGAD